MPVTEAIVLAGGLGTRLREAVPDLPKCMASVNGKPFIYYVVRHLQNQGIQKIIFSLGYRSEAFMQFLSEELQPENYEIAVEKEPLGTGGAIQFAAGFAKEQNIVVVNGDSIFQTDLAALSAFHFEKKADCTLALKPMVSFDRYGVVELNPDQSIALFKEKQFYEKGLINGGTYLLNIDRFLSEDLPQKFSFETDYLQQFYPVRNMYGLVQEGYFIDIGIPEDYKRAQTELK